MASQMPVQLPSASSKDRVGSTDSDNGPLSLPFFYQHKDDVDRAEATYRAAVQADPSDAVAYVNLGILLQSEKKDLDGAEEAFRAATVVDPSNPQWHLNLGSIIRLASSPPAETRAHTPLVNSADHRCPARRGAEGLRGREGGLSRGDPGESELRRCVQLPRAHAAGARGR
mmetsp:Transcript_4112/g.8549  ORF Transcript_4112/g.8549 Transcript_4112/m.8549 type:complete len:171 (+) Transcript_4112:57-569(+)